MSSALDILNASITSELVQEMFHSPGWAATSDGSPLGSKVPAPEHSDELLMKCRTVIEELQEELGQERRRRSELESRVVEARSEVDAVMEELDSIRKQNGMYIEEVTRLKMESLELGRRHASEASELQAKLRVSEECVGQKELELENMTKHFEKRMAEMRRVVASSNANSREIVTPPVPDQILLELKNQLVASSAALRARDAETRNVVASYESQVKALRAELNSTREIMQSVLNSEGKVGECSMYTPSPVLASPAPISAGATHAEWQKFLNHEFSKLSRGTI